MSSTISASSAIAPTATNDAPERSPLQQLLDRAQAASDRMALTNPHRGLLLDFSVALVALARMNADLAQQLADRVADPPRIVLP